MFEAILGWSLPCVRSRLYVGAMAHHLLASSQPLLEWIIGGHKCWPEDHFNSTCCGCGDGLLRQVSSSEQSDRKQSLLSARGPRTMCTSFA